MTSDTINYPVNFVVFDMEWNQPISYLPSSIDPKLLPGEIIEIGAVKLTMHSEEKYTLSSPFSLIIKPEYYKIMNKQVSRVINKSTDDLKCGLPFPVAYQSFLDWCGEDCILCAWGDSDVSILKANLRVHKMSPEINPRFLDVQPLFGRVAEDTAQQRSVAYAVDFYKIPQTDDFHSADRDAYYEAVILKETLIDYFQLSRKKTPDAEKELPPLKQFVSNPNLTTQKKWSSSVFPSEKAAVKAALKEEMSCPICDMKLDEVIPWFSSGHTWLSLWQCPKHLLLSGKIRAKKTPKQEHYASGQIRFVNGNAARYVREKWQEKEMQNEQKVKLPGSKEKCEHKCEQL